MAQKLDQFLIVLALSIWVCVGDAWGQFGPSGPSIPSGPSGPSVPSPGRPGGNYGRPSQPNYGRPNQPNYGRPSTPQPGRPNYGQPNNYGQPGYNNRPGQPNGSSPYQPPSYSNQPYTGPTFNNPLFNTPSNPNPQTYVPGSQIQFGHTPQSRIYGQPSSLTPQWQQARDAFGHGRKQGQVYVDRMLKQDRSLNGYMSAISAMEQANAPRTMMNNYRTQAMEMAQSQIKNNTRDPMAYVTVAKFSLEDGNDARFRQATQQLLDQHPEHKYTHYFKGMQALKDEDWTTAEQSLQEAIDAGIPKESVALWLKMAIDRQRWIWQYATIVMWVTLGWLGGLVILFVTGKTLSGMTVGATRRDDLTSVGFGQRGLRRIYRWVINLAGVYYYFSLPIILVLSIAAPLAIGYALLNVPFLNLWLVAIVFILGIGSVMTALSGIRACFVRIRDDSNHKDVPRDDQPKLWQLVDEVAEKVGTRTVDRIWLVPGAELGVVERGGFFARMRDRGERVLILGFAMLDGFKQTALRSVLAHEFGHFHNRDTAGGDVSLRVNVAMSAFAEAIMMRGKIRWYDLAVQFLRFYYFLFTRLTFGASRLQEVMADHIAVQNYGAPAFKEGLQHAIRRSVDFDFCVSKNIGVLLRNAAEPANFFRTDERPSIAMRDEMEEVISRKTTIDDTHPSPTDRFAFADRMVGNIPPIDHGLVWDLFENQRALTQSMQRILKPMLDDEVALSRLITDAQLDYLNEIIRHHPHSAAFEERASIHLERGDFNSALQDVNRALQKAPQSDSPRFLRVVIYRAMKNFKAATDELMQMLADEPGAGDAEFQYLLGDSFYKQDRFQEAELALNRSIQLDETPFAIWTARGRTLAKQQKWQAAISDFDHAICRSDKLPEVFFERGQAYLALGNVGQALTDFRQAIKIDPAYREAHIELAKLLLDCEEHRDAATALIHAELARSMENADDLDAAELVNRVLVANGEEPDELIIDAELSDSELRRIDTKSGQRDLSKRKRGGYTGSIIAAGMLLIIGGGSWFAYWNSSSNEFPEVEQPNETALNSLENSDPGSNVDVNPAEVNENPIDEFDQSDLPDKTLATSPNNVDVGRPAPTIVKPVALKRLDRKLYFRTKRVLPTEVNQFLVRSMTSTSELKVYELDLPMVRQCVWSRDGEQFYFIGADQRASVLHQVEIRGLKVIRTLTFPSHAYFFCQSKDHLIACGFNGELFFVNPKTLHLEKQLPLQERGMQGIAGSPNSQFIYCWTQQELFVVDTQSAKVLYKINRENLVGKNAPNEWRLISKVAVNWSGRNVLVTDDYRVLKWDVASDGTMTLNTVAKVGKSRDIHGPVKSIDRSLTVIRDEDVQAFRNDDWESPLPELVDYSTAFVRHDQSIVGFKAPSLFTYFDARGKRQSSFQLPEGARYSLADISVSPHPDKPFAIFGSAKQFVVLDSSHSLDIDFDLVHDNKRFPLRPRPIEPSERAAGFMSVPIHFTVKKRAWLDVISSPDRSEVGSENVILSSDGKFLIFVLKRLVCRVSLDDYKVVEKAFVGKSPKIVRCLEGILCATENGLMVLDEVSLKSKKSFELEGQVRAYAVEPGSPRVAVSYDMPGPGSKTSVLAILDLNKDQCLFKAPLPILFGPYFTGINQLAFDDQGKLYCLSGDGSQTLTRFAISDDTFSFEQSYGFTGKTDPALTYDPFAKCIRLSTAATKKFGVQEAGIVSINGDESELAVAKHTPRRIGIETESGVFYGNDNGWTHPTPEQRLNQSLLNRYLPDGTFVGSVKAAGWKEMKEIDCVLPHPDGKRVFGFSTDRFYCINLLDMPKESPDKTNDDPLEDGGRAKLTATYRTETFAHRDGISDIAFSPDGRFIVSGGTDRFPHDHSAYVWEIATRRLVHIFPMTRGSVKSVAYSPDGETIATTDYEGEVVFWDPESGERRESFQKRSQFVSGLKYSPNGIDVAMIQGGQIHLTRGDINKPQRMDRHQQVSEVIFSPKGDMLLSCGLDRSFKLWDVTTGKVIRNFTSSESPVMSVAFSPDGKRFSTALESGKIQEWQVEDGTLLSSFEHKSNGVDSLHYSPDGRFIAAIFGSSQRVGNRQSNVCVFDLDRAHQQAKIDAGEKPATDIEFSPDGKLLAIATHYGAVQFYDLKIEAIDPPEPVLIPGLKVDEESNE